MSQVRLLLRLSDDLDRPGPNPSEPRIDDIGGDLTPEWGMHLIDVNVAMGDLVSLARSEGKAFRRR
jgi:hypothetical protein